MKLPTAKPPFTPGGYPADQAEHCIGHTGANDAHVKNVGAQGEQPAVLEN